MRNAIRPGLVLAAIGALFAGLPLRAEDLGQAWEIALGVNQGLQAQQSQSMSAGMNLAAAKSARFPTLRTYNFNSSLTASPSFRNPQLTGASGTRTGTAPGGSAATFAIPTTVPVLGNGQRDLPVSFTYASQPLYTGGRLKRSVDQAKAQVGVQKSEEFRTALDLKLTVAQAYVAVLRARKALDVARSNVTQLASFTRDVRNRREQGLAIRSDELAAEVSLANARLSEIQARTTLASAWSTYNRYLCRPFNTVVPLVELSDLSTTADVRGMAEQAVRASESVADADENEVGALTELAIRSRPELVGLYEQARSFAAQADVTRAGVLPQASFNMGFLFLGSNNSVPQGIGAATFLIDWTISDSGATRRRARALRFQEDATLKRKADTAADIALEVRTRWLDLWQARQRVPVARLAVAQSEENSKVVGDRYREQLSTYTEVLDAETRRIQSLNNFYNSAYDESLAQFRLRRAVGDL